MRLLAGYAVTGPADASATVLCFNPGGANLISWEIASELLAAAGVRLVLHDCRGLGHSDVPAAHDAKEDFDAQFHFDTYSDDAAALLAHLGITEPVVIAGSSWGARPAAATGARFGAQASALVLFDISFGKADRPVQESGERLARDKCKRLGISEPRLDFSRIAGGEKAMRTTMATAKARKQCTMAATYRRLLAHASKEAAAQPTARARRSPRRFFRRAAAASSARRSWPWGAPPLPPPPPYQYGLPA